MSSCRSRLLSLMVGTSTALVHSNEASINHKITSWFATEVFNLRAASSCYCVTVSRKSYTRQSAQKRVGPLVPLHYVDRFESFEPDRVEALKLRLADIEYRHNCWWFFGWSCHINSLAWINLLKIEPVTQCTRTPLAAPKNVRVVALLFDFMPLYNLQSHKKTKALLSLVHPKSQPS